MLRKKLRAMLMARQKVNDLPAGYTQLDYIESTGTQYIDTGILDQNSNLKIEVNFILNEYYNTYDYVLGTWTKDSHNNTVCMIRKDYKDIGAWVDSAFSKNIVTSFTVGKMSNIIIRNDGFTYNGTIFKGTTKGTYRAPLSIYLFRRNGTPAQTSSIKAKVFDVKFYDKDTLIMYLIPVLDTNNKPCFYDTISKKTFYNAGTGTFLYGAIIS